jgi:hypothetical protein
VSASLAGCGGLNDRPANRSASESATPPSSTTRPSTERTATLTDGPTATDSPTDGPTATDSPTPTDTPTNTERLRFGEFYRFDGSWDVSVVSVRATDLFEVDRDEGFHRMPGNEVLLLTETRLRTTDGEAGDWTANAFDFRDDGEAVADDQAEFDHPELGRVFVSELSRVDHGQQYTTGGQAVAADETARAWWMASVVETELDGELCVGFDPVDGGASPEALWCP